MSTEKYLERFEVGNQIGFNTDIILGHWEKIVRAEVPAAKHQNKVALLDSLPLFIHELVKILQCPEPTEEAEQKAEVAKEHAEDRVDHPEYTLEQMISEYQILRTVVMDFLVEHSLDNPESNRIINDFIDRGIRKAAVEYSKLETKKQLESIVTLGLLHKASEDDQLALTQTVKLLKDERDRRDRFIAALTHDLRTPLTSAKMGAQYIARQYADSEKISYTAKRIVSSMDRADKMIRDLLDADLLRAGRVLPLSIENCSLNAIAESVVAELSAIYGPRFVIECEEEAIEGKWDCLSVQRMIENLCANAVKYGQQGTTVTIHLRSQGSLCEILVHNYGNPIAPEDLVSIFDPYQRARAAQESAQIGWGVGLSLVKSIAEAHGGSISASSSEEIGTVFTLILPRIARSAT